MAQDYAPLMFLIPWVILIGIALSMIVQGWMIMNAHNGYTKSPKVKHPEMNDVQPGDPLLFVKFTEEDTKQLQQKVIQQRIDELLGELSTHEDEDDEQLNV